MRWFKLLILMLLGAILLSPAFAQVQLQGKLPEKFYVELKSDYQRVLRTTKGETKDYTESTQVFAVTVLKSEANGTRVVELKVEAMKDVTTDAAGKKKESTHPEWQDATVQITLDPAMNITKVAGLEEILKKADPKGTLKATAKAYQLDHLENLFRYWSSQVFIPLSAKPVNKGDKWEQKLVRPLSAYGTLKLTRELTYQGTESVSGQEQQKLTFTTAHAFSPIKVRAALPFDVTRVSFNKAENTGTLYFDSTGSYLLRSDSKEYRDIVMTLTYDEGQKEVRIRDEGNNSVRFHEQKPAAP